jgi:hypothetical protein
VIRSWTGEQAFCYKKGRQDVKQREKSALIMKARKQIAALTEKRDKIYGDLCQKLQLDYNGPDVLFDFMYNGFNRYRTLKNLLKHLE